MAFTFETQEELIQFVREQISLEIDFEYDMYSDGHSGTVRANVTLFGQEIAEESMSASR